MALQFNYPPVDPYWASSRETDLAVAAAIFAISDKKRSPEKIWEAPTDAEFDHVVMAVQNYVDNGLAPRQERYHWGQESFSIDEE